MTNKVISTSKRELLKYLKPTAVKKSRKRKRDDEFDPLLDIFDQEDDLQEFYNKEGSIRMDEIPALPTMYVALEKKELINELDLQEPVVMTMLN